MTYKELKERQSWSLEQKIDHSLGVIDQFYHKLDGKVYISFSGGKDSTVLLWLARKIFPDIKAVFCNTGNEYPDIVKFVRAMKERGENIEIIYPKLKPREVLANYGFPLVSKMVSEYVHGIRVNPNTQTAKMRLGLINNPHYRNPKAYRTLPNKWKYLVDEEYETSNKCCEKLKKEPFRDYESQKHLAPILGTMADESKQREQDYISRGGV